MLKGAARRALGCRGSVLAVYGNLHGVGPKLPTSSLSSKRGIRYLAEPKGGLVVRPPLASAILRGLRRCGLPINTSLACILPSSL